VPEGPQEAEAGPGRGGIRQPLGGSEKFPECIFRFMQESSKFFPKILTRRMRNTPLYEFLKPNSSPLKR
jgi:hypothetical protein